MGTRVGLVLVAPVCLLVTSFYLFILIYNGADTWEGKLYVALVAELCLIIIILSIVAIIWAVRPTSLSN